MISYSYNIITTHNGDNLVLHDKDEPIGPPLKMVSIAYSIDDEDPLMITLHKHGAPERVKNWVDIAKAKLSKSEGLGQEMADAINIVTGAWHPNLINEVIQGNRKALWDLVKNTDAIDVATRVIEDETPNRSTQRSRP